MDAMFKGLLGAIGMLIAIFVVRAVVRLISKISSKVKQAMPLSLDGVKTDDEMHYEIAAKEVDKGNQRYGLWEKSLVMANGATDAARREYIKLRVIQLKDAGENPVYVEIESK